MVSSSVREISSLSSFVVAQRVGFLVVFFFFFTFKVREAEFVTVTNVDDDDGNGEIRCAGFVGANASTRTTHDVLRMAVATTTGHVVAIGRRLGRRWCLCMFVIVMVQLHTATSMLRSRTELILWDDSLFQFPP